MEIIQWSLGLLPGEQWETESPQITRPSFSERSEGW
jgi:hypothetical protein